MTQQQTERGRIIRREVLDHAARAPLAELLKPFATFLSRHEIDLVALANTSLEDRALVGHIYELVHDDTLAEPPPDDLLDALSALDTLATSDAAAALIANDKEVRLPRGVGDEELALFALLHHPELAALVAAESAREAEHKFAEYAPSERGPALSLGKRELTRLETLIGERCAVLDHTRYCHAKVMKNRWYVELEIGHGSRAKTRDTIDPRTLALRQITDVTARRAFARLERRTGRLSIRAYPKVREIVREAFGEVLAGDSTHFRVDGLYDLVPFKNLETALAAERPVKSVEMHLLGVLTVDGVSLVAKRTRRDLMASSARSLIESVAHAGTPNWVRLYLHTEGHPRPIRVELMADEKRNVVDFNRDDPDVRRSVERFLASKRVLLARDSDDAPVSETSAE